jgi:hypothetical protein
VRHFCQTVQADSESDLKAGLKLSNEAIAGRLVSGFSVLGTSEGSPKPQDMRSHDGGKRMPLLDSAERFVGRCQPCWI